MSEPTKDLNRTMDICHRCDAVNSHKAYCPLNEEYKAAQTLLNAIVSGYTEKDVMTVHAVLSAERLRTKKWAAEIARKGMPKTMATPSGITYSGHYIGGGDDNGFTWRADDIATAIESGEVG